MIHMQDRIKIEECALDDADAHDRGGEVPPSGEPRGDEASNLLEVIDRARRFEADAFDIIVDRYAFRLMGFFRRSSGSREDAEDLVQEVFIRLVKTIGEYREEGRFEAWLFRIAGNLARDHQRRKHVDSNHNIGEGSRQGDLGARSVRVRHHDETPPQSFEHTDRLQAGLARLADAEREVILLRHFGELTFAEIAQYLAAPLGTVLARSHRGLAKLRQWMEQTHD